MLSKTMVDKLNAQINLEYFSSNIYLQMSAWCAYKGLEGCADFLRKQADEEMMHMHKLFDYVNETGAMAVVGQIDAPPVDFKSIKELFTKTYEHECLVTKRINEMVAVAMKEPDYATFNFLQWYVAEQHEEETVFKGILDKIELIGVEGRGVYLFDKYIGKLAAQNVEPVE